MKPLYKKTSTGAIQMWHIEVDDNVLVTTYGQVNGKQQVIEETIWEGKNVGRSNETSPEEQAVLEAQSQWDKKVKKGYVTDIEDAKAGKVDETVIKGGIVPMTAETYAKYADRVEFPAIVQPKLDGHRCLAVVNDDGSVTLWSRSRKEILSVPHVNEAIRQLFLRPGMILDGELYNHDYHDRFEDLTSLIRQTGPKEGHEVIQYHVYDVADLKYKFQTRINFIAPHLFDGQVNRNEVLKLVQCVEVESPEEITEAFTEFLRQGYEGAMVRNRWSMYVNKRSKDLLKVKVFDDAEYEIVDAVSGRGRMEGKAIFVCRTGSLEHFQVKLTGKLDDLTGILTNKHNYIGKMLTVQYQGLTNGNVPRFPVGLRVREDV